MSTTYISVPQPYVIVIDDDPGMSKSIEFLLNTEKIKSICFSSGTDFFEQLKSDPSLIEGPGCILLDVRMPDMNGIEVFERLASLYSDLTLPVSFITAHGDVPLVTKVLKQGAIDFIQKPFSAEDLVLRVHQYFDISRLRYQQKIKINQVLARINELTERERTVMDCLYEGLSNKEIAESLGNSVRTIELRRASIYDKLQVKSVVELARLLESINWETHKQA
jgi:RNA polymerase sigma factor (sigma-70 family)